MGYLEYFLFTRDRARAIISALSGGERNRLLLARMFAQPANLLVLDEPTYDLDLETLEVLEGLLMDYPGTLLLVSYDRAFLNNLVTTTLELVENGQVREYIGGYDDRQQQKQAETPQKSPPKPANAAKSSSGPPKLTYKEQRALEAHKQELAELPVRIEALETEHHQLAEAMANSAFFQRPETDIVQAVTRLKELERDIGQAYQRWEELEQRQ